ncbi:hypothetical protein [Phenylobacterium sp.]
MRYWRLLIVLSSAASALAVGLDAQARAEHTDLMALLSSALGAIT